MIRRMAATNLRSEYPSSPIQAFNPRIHGFSTRSLSPRKPNWNTTHSFVLSNPILSLLERCTCMSHLKQIQCQMTTTGLILDGLASSRLVAFCALPDAGDLAHCYRILKFVPNLKPFSWNVAIKRCSESDFPREAFLLYREMLVHGGSSRPDNYTYPLLFKSCARLSGGSAGFQVLGHVVKMGLGSDVYAVNGMLHMLVSCGDLVEARKVFDESPVRDLVTWNSLINGYARCGMAREALDLYDEMAEEGVVPDEVTMIGLVSSCAQLGDLSSGKRFHLYIQRNKVRLTAPLCNALMDMYVKCGSLEEAQVLFDNMAKKTVVSWTTMSLGYAKFGSLDAARKLFDEMPEKDVIPWNAMIGAYAQAGLAKEALAIFDEMQASNVTPDEVTMVSCLSACSQLEALDFGVWIHRYIERNTLCLNVAVGTALVDMYAKCANIEKALDVFHQMSVKNALTWTAIIGGLALHGNAHEAISYFAKMVETGLAPDEVTYLGVLSACCHGGLVDEGRSYFSEMSSKYKLKPKLKHYSCMVDLLGRAGQLNEAEALIKSMPIEPDAVVWGALFFACRMHGNLLMGEKAAMKLLELDPGDSGIYVLLANMYGDAGMWEQAKKVRYMMVQRGVEKTPGCSAIEVNGTLNEFIVRDKSHPRSEEIYGCLVQLTKHMELIENIWSVRPVVWDSLVIS